MRIINKIYDAYKSNFSFIVKYMSICWDYIFRNRNKACCYFDGRVEDMAKMWICNILSLKFKLILWKFLKYTLFVHVSFLLLLQLFLFKLVDGGRYGDWVDVGQHGLALFDQLFLRLDTLRGSPVSVPQSFVLGVATFLKETGILR